MESKFNEEFKNVDEKIKVGRKKLDNIKSNLNTINQIKTLLNKQAFTIDAESRDEEEINYQLFQAVNAYSRYYESELKKVLTF